MNILVFLAGISVGWAADKLYISYRAKKTHSDEDNETPQVEAEEKDFAVENVKQEQTTTKKSKTETDKKPLAGKEPLEERHDDLSQLSGVGPKLAEALDSIGIYTYEQLAEPPVDILLERLRETDGRFSRTVISAIMERAKQAAEER